MQPLPVRRPRTELLVVHCSATPPQMDIGREEIDRWHRERGFSQIGYHWVVRRDGTIEAGRPAWALGAHVKHHNSESLGICLVGGVDEYNDPQANFTQAQYDSLRTLCVGLSLAYPHIKVVGHRDLDPHKACPSFDAVAWWEEVRPTE